MWRYWNGQAWTDHRAPMAPASQTVTKHEEAPIAPVVTSTNASSSISREASGPATTKPDVTEIYLGLKPDPKRRDLDEQVEVVGETYHIKGIKRLFRDHGLPVTGQGEELNSGCALVPEPWNSHDTNAIAVVIDGHHVGYLPAELAVDYSPFLRALAASRLMVVGEARVWAKNDRGVLRARVTILIPEADALAE